LGDELLERVLDVGRYALPIRQGEGAIYQWTDGMSAAEVQEKPPVEIRGLVGQETAVGTG